MVLDLASNAFLSVIDLIKIAFFASIPAFIAVILGKKLKEMLEEKFKGSWLRNSFIVTYVFCLIIVAFLYVFPLMSALGEVDTAGVPEELNPTLADSIIAFFWSVVKVVFSAFVIAVLLIPLEFVGLYVFEWIQKKYKFNYFAELFLGVFSASLVAVIVLLFLFPWTLTGLIYLIYFA
ncbi:MAG: hypothetical protein AB1467_05875 [Candidatus Diapherotrites archaeon]